MEIKLTRPVVFFDLETTGTSITHDRIVELSYIKVYPDGKEDSETIRVNPGCHIPARQRLYITLPMPMWPMHLVLPR